MAKNIKNKRVSSGQSRVTKGKRLDISLRAVIDNMAFSKSDRWAYYRLSNLPYDFLDSDSKYQLGKQIHNAFVSLMAERQTPLECHLVVDSTPIDVEALRQQNLEESRHWMSNSANFEDYLDLQEEFLRGKEYMEKVVYLGVHLGRRGSQDIDAMGIIEGGIKSAVDTAREALKSVMLSPTDVIAKSEEEYTRNRESEIYQVLSTGHLQATRVTSEDILLMIKRQLYPSMPAPYLDVDPDSRLGPGDLALEFGHSIWNRFRWLKIGQIVGDEEMHGHRATLAFSKFPRQSQFPESYPFMYFLSRLGLPFTMFSRFSLYPTEHLKKEIDKQTKEVVDGVKNYSVGGETIDSAVSGFPPELQGSLDDIQTVKTVINGDKAPWISGSYYVVVETPTEQLLKKYCAIVKQKFTDLDINVTWTAGDQAKLFLEQMPGDKVRVGAFTQITNIGQLGASGMNFASEVGDEIKPRRRTDRVGGRTNG